MKYKCLSAVMMLGGLMGVASAEPVNLKPGQWQYTMTMTLANGGIDPIVETETSCMKAWESKLEPTALAQEFAGGAECEARDVTQTANLVSFKLSCPGEAMDNSEFTMTHQFSSFAMDGKLQIPNGNGGFITADMKVIANNTGACTE